MMPLLDKLFPSRKSFRNKVQTIVTSNVETEEDDRNSALYIGAGQVRILLFRECEWRGRKLLFDSLSLEKRWCKNKTATINLKKNTGNSMFEGERMAEDDVSLLSEMVFGTVAMTYRGSSFKIHSMNSPSCIMCTKVFPATEHNICKQQTEKVSDEGLGRSVNLDSNPSMRTLLSRPSSGNLSGSELNTGVRKNSTCSSTGSGWNIDIPPPTGSSQSLESNGSSGIGSLSSLRRRWLRAASTSLARLDSDDTFGMQYWTENGNDNKEIHTKRHKTRLGLTMLVQLAEGHERRIETCLLEHMALLEGMLDRLRYFCIESGSINAQNKGMQLPERLYRSSQFVVSLLRLLTNIDADLNSRTPLLWHDVLLNSVKVEHKISALHRSLEQMCQLLDNIDTKSSNFFLSTVVTAVLTYHLGWIYTTLPIHDRQLMEKLGTWYPCNPLWVQLGDLYGALSNPIRVAHTVVAGDPQKVDLINSVLSFLSYFIRSGVVQKRQEYCNVTEEDIQEAASLLEQARLKRPHLFTTKATTNDRESMISRRVLCTSVRKKIAVQELSYDAEDDNAIMQSSYPEYNEGRLRVEGSISSLKRSITMESNLDSFILKTFEPETDTKFISKKLPRDDDGNEKSTVNERTCTSSKVKIVVSEIAPQDVDLSKTGMQQCPEFSLRNFEKKVEDNDLDETYTNSKIDAFQDFDDTCVDTLKLYSSRPEFETGQSTDNEMKNSHVFFTLGDEEKSVKTLSRPRLGYNCQCSYMFTRVPSTSAQLPEDVLRKIIQRNFPESSKSIHPPGAVSRSLGFCQRCNGQGYVPPQNYDSCKQVLETPTNATEVLRTCGNTVGDGSVGLSRSNSLEALMEANSVVELPMPRTKKMKKTDSHQDTGFTKTLLQNRIKPTASQGLNNSESSYTWGLVLQGLPKKKKRRRKKVVQQEANRNDYEIDKELWYCIREECLASVRFPTIDQPIAESLCILADLDTWHVGIISNNMPSHTAPLPVGMSRLVANMLEGFAYLWRKYHSTSQCIGILEAKLREMWLKSETLAEMLLATEVCDANVACLTHALDLDAADIPLLLAVATSHSPEIGQRSSRKLFLVVIISYIF